MKKQLIHITRTTAIISGIFILVIGVLLLLNYFNLKSTDPLEAKSLEVLVEQLAEDPNNDGLKKEIR
ncbi:MAG: hypothetical protein MI922_12065, partial [Bacteroidales bacterium]|nr:hypothetical protein [Bacteroidales bacterium]